MEISDFEFDPKTNLYHMRAYCPECQKTGEGAVRQEEMQQYGNLVLTDWMRHIIAGKMRPMGCRHLEEILNA